MKSIPTLMKPDSPPTSSFQCSKIRRASSAMAAVVGVV